MLVYKETLMASSSNIAPEIPSDLTDLLQEYSDLFPDENPKGLPPVREGIHQGEPQPLCRSCSTCAQKGRFLAHVRGLPSHQQHNGKV